MLKELNILSLFDGMGCLAIALKESNIKYNTYYSSEIDKFANQQTALNFPDHIQLGSVCDVDVFKLKPIGFLGGGSPCQSFSFAGKRKGMATKCEMEILSLEHYLELKSAGFEFEGQSYLFWEYMRILTDIRKYNPDVKFLLENVEMGEKWEKVLSKAIGVNGIHINSALVSAQNRKRIYWTNIGLEPGGLFGDLESIIQQPKDRKILLKDILQPVEEVDSKYYLSEKMMSYFKTRASNFNNGKINIRSELEKASTITASCKSVDISDNFIKVNLLACAQQVVGNRTEDVLHLPDGKFHTLCAENGGKVRGKGLFVFPHIRRLTPVECSRLQTIPDWYKWKVSDTQIYKMCGNGWTVQVICHILSYLERQP
jgi:DNA (cytosine-5)-methyltransferase 3A